MDSGDINIILTFANKTPSQIHLST